MPLEPGDIIRADDANVFTAFHTHLEPVHFPLDIWINWKLDHANTV